MLEFVSVRHPWRRVRRVVEIERISYFPAPPVLTRRNTA